MKLQVSAFVSHCLWCMIWSVSCREKRAAWSVTIVSMRRLWLQQRRKGWGGLAVCRRCSGASLPGLFLSESLQLLREGGGGFPLTFTTICRFTCDCACIGVDVMIRVSSFLVAVVGCFLSPSTRRWSYNFVSPDCLHDVFIVLWAVSNYCSTLYIVWWIIHYQPPSPLSPLYYLISPSSAFFSCISLL